MKRRHINAGRERFSQRLSRCAIKSTREHVELVMSPLGHLLDDEVIEKSDGVLDRGHFAAHVQQPRVRAVHRAL